MTVITMFNFSLASTALSLVLSQSPPAPPLPTVDEVIASVRKAELQYAARNIDLRFRHHWVSFRKTPSGQEEVTVNLHLSQTVQQEGKYRFKARSEASEKTGAWEKGNQDIGFDGTTTLTKFLRDVQTSKNQVVSANWEPHRPHGFSLCGSIPFHMWLRGGDEVRRSSDGHVNEWESCDIKTEVIGREKINSLDCLRLRCIVNVINDVKKGPYELGRYSIWLATTRNYIPIRTKYVKASHPEVLSHDWEMNDLFEPHPGLWLPRRSVQTIYDFWNSKRDKPILMHKHRFDIISVAMNPRYPDDFFRDIVAEPPAPPEPPHVPQSPAEQFIFDLKNQQDAKTRNATIAKWTAGIGIPLVALTLLAFWWIRRRPLRMAELGQVPA